MCQGFTARLVADVSAKKKKKKKLWKMNHTDTHAHTKKKAGQKKNLINIEIFLLQRKTNAAWEQKPLSVICKAGLLASLTHL